MPKKILIIGDSVAKGVGASKKENTFEGFLRKDFPKAKIENHAVSGAKAKDVLKQIKKTKEKKYDLIIMNFGMNDIFHFTDYKEIRGETKKLLNSVGEKGKKIIFSTGGDIDLAPKIIWPLNKIFSGKERKLIRMFRRFSKKLGITYVDLLKERKVKKQIMKNPKKYLSKDNLHPNDEGYKLWYQFLKKNF